MALETEASPDKRLSDHQVDVHSDSEDFRCPCGRAVPRPTHKYGNVQANDHSIIFQGDIQSLVLHCQPEDVQYPLNSNAASRNHVRSTEDSQSSKCASREPPDSQEHSAAIGEQSSIGDGQNQESAAGVASQLGERQNIASIETPVARSEQLLSVGLQKIVDGNEHSVFWKAISSFSVESIWLVISDAIIDEDAASRKDPGRPSEHVWTASQIVIETHRESALRRICIIAPQDMHAVWVPDTSIKVFCSGKSIELYFSNCNNLHNAGHYSSQDQRAISVATYDAKTPNVKLKIDFEREPDTAEFRNIVLQNKRPCRSTIHETSELRLAQGSFVTNDLTFKDSIFIWKREMKSDTGSTYEYHDILRISERFDLELNLSGAQIEVLFRFMDRLRYRGIDEQSKLPWEIERTQDGGPAKVRMNGADGASELRLSVSSEDTRSLINRIASERTSWHLEDFFLNTRVKSLAMKNGRMGKSTTKYSAQLTLWSNRSSFRMLLRCSNTDSGISNPQDPLWCSLEFDKSQPPAPVRMKSNKFVFHELRYEVGDNLSTANLRLSQSGTNDDGGDDKTRLKDLELEFDQAADSDRFRNIVAGKYLLVDG